MFLRAVRIRDLVILVVLCNQVQHDRATLENLDLAFILVFVGQSRDASIWIDLEKPWLFLFVFIEVYGHDLEGKCFSTAGRLG